jgi:hypothetical protein
LPTLSDYRQDYYWFSGKTSDIARQLALAGIVVIWIFRTGNNSKPQLPSELLLPLFLLVTGLALDLLHYIVATIIWGSFQRHYEKKLDDISTDPEISAPRYFNWPVHTIFSLKLLSIISAYFFLLSFFWHLWF